MLTSQFFHIIVSVTSWFVEAHPLVDFLETFLKCSLSSAMLEPLFLCPWKLKDSLLCTPLSFLVFTLFTKVSWRLHIAFYYVYFREEVDVILILLHLWSILSFCLRPSGLLLYLWSLIISLKQLLNCLLLVSFFNRLFQSG